jgi:NCS1 family nucleobase:cation symporter-1
MINQGMNWWQAVLTIFLGNAIVLVPMLLNGHAGAKYGIPFPVFARASFGTKGANIPAILRAIVACGWFGIQTWIGGASLYNLLRAWNPFPPTLTVSLLYHFLAAEYVCYLQRRRQYQETACIQSNFFTTGSHRLILLGCYSSEGPWSHSQ